MKKLLLEGDDAGSAARLIAVNPTLRSQAEALLPALERAKEKADHQTIRNIMVRHAPTYALQDRSPEEWTQLFRVYVDALDGFSEHQIEDAFRRWNRGEGMKDPAMGQFYPQPSQLVHLANAAKSEVWMAAYRARKALEHVDSRPKEVDPGEKAKVAEAFAELVGTFKAKTLPENMRPRLTPQQVAARLRGASDEDVVL